MRIEQRLSDVVAFLAGGAKARIDRRRAGWVWSRQTADELRSDERSMRSMKGFNGQNGTSTRYMNNGDKL